MSFFKSVYCENVNSFLANAPILYLKTFDFQGLWNGNTDQKWVNFLKKASHNFANICSQNYFLILNNTILLKHLQFNSIKEITNIIARTNWEASFSDLLLDHATFNNIVS